MYFSYTPENFYYKNYVKYYKMQIELSLKPAYKVMSAEIMKRTCEPLNERNHETSN